MAPTKKISRSIKAQIDFMCKYMNSHLHFATGDYKTPNGAAQQERQWSELKAALDELGPQRTVEQWKVCLRDQKRKARVEGGALNKSLNTTGNQGAVPELSQNSQIILATIGEEMAQGIGPQESPVGNSGHPPPPPPAALEHALVSPTPGLILCSVQPPHPVPAPATVPPGTSPGTARRLRVRKSHPPEQFINAQLELNSLIKDLIKEVRKGNELKQEHNN